MPIVSRIIPNTYRDSVALMQLSASLKTRPGIEEASAIVATAGNLALLREVGLLEGDMTPQPSNLLVIARAKTAASGEAALDAAAEALSAQAPAATGSGPTAMAPRSIQMAFAEATGANLAVVSVPGEYAAAEAEKALRLGLNVLLFSDNVPVDDEIALKRLAASRGLLLMGPDCGTAIIDGVPLAFANNVRRGPIGCVAASGTGLQQVTALVDRLGSGVSQAIGTGGRDLSEAVGGLTMLAGLARLAADRDTKVIVLISKPPAAAVAQRVLAQASKARKPVVVCFVGADPAAIRGKDLYPVATLDEAARTAVALAQGKSAPKRAAARRFTVGARLARGLKPGQRYVRGLFSGGTFCYEASLVLGSALGRVWSNAPVRAEDELDDPWKSREHTLVDLGDDAFTRGRPHPMIDHGLRNERIVREARDPAVAVILLDVVLGHGAHPDPAAAMAPALAAVAKGKQEIALVASVCGTETDPQGLAKQEQALREHGVILGASNAEAARIAAAIARI